MSNKIHRLLGQGDLHTPERSGYGDPNELALDYLVDGQYYQDKFNGSVYRYSSSNERWDLLIGYNQSSNKITNVSNNLEQSKIGELRSTIGKDNDNESGLITSVPAYLYAQVREGEDILVISVDDSEQKITLTVSETTNAGEVSIPVQPQSTQKTFLEGSAIQIDGGLIQSYFTIDPTKLSIGIEGEKNSTSLGVVNSALIASGQTRTSLTFSKPSLSLTNKIELKDGQVLTLQRRTGDFQEIIVDGDQSFSSSPFTVNFESFTTEFLMGLVNYDLVTYLIEPAYKASSRISLTESSIELSVQYNDNGSYIELLAGQAGSEITIQSDQINITGVINAINSEGVTTIDGGRITTDSILADQIDTSDLFAEQLTIGSKGGVPGYIQSFVYEAGVSGFRINSDGTAEFRDVTVDGQIITDTGSSIDGQYIKVNTIEADKIDVVDLFSEQLTIGSKDGVAGYIQSTGYSAGSAGFRISAGGSAEFNDVTVRGTIDANSGTLSGLNVDGALTVASGGSISGSNYEFTDAGGNVAGWEIQTGLLRSASSGARVELNKTKNRVSIFDGVNEKVTMGYLDGLPKNDGTGNWTSSDYGFWARGGDSLQIDGSIDYRSGDFIVQDDASVKIFDVVGNEIVRLGTDTGDKGLFIYDTSGNSLARFFDTGIEIGDPTSSSYLELSGGSAFFSGGIVAGSGEISGPTSVTTLYDAYGNIAKYGDVNLNGVINTEDASIVLKYVVGALSLSSYQLYLADVSGNGIVNSLDASQILAGTGNTGVNAVDAVTPFYTDCKLEFNVDDSFIKGTGDNRSSTTETFFRIAPFNSFINVLRTDFLSSEYIYTDIIRSPSLVSQTINIDTSYFDSSSNELVYNVNMYGGLVVDNENASNGQPATANRANGLHVIGDTRLQGDIRLDATTATGATAGTNGDVPAQVVGYLVVNISGSAYKIPYYNT